MQQAYHTVLDFQIMYVYIIFASDHTIQSYICRLTLLGLKSAKFANASPPPPLTDPENGSELPKGSLGNADPNGSGLLGRDGLDAGDFLGGAGLGGGAFFCLGGKAGRGDSERLLLGGEGAKGSLPNKSPLDLCKTNGDYMYGKG